jgi:hypothetical protein
LKEIFMTASDVFSIANPFALLGWLILGFAVVRKNAWLRDTIAGFFWPLALSGLYVGLILLFFGQGQGGFNSLAEVKQLFQSDWLLLAGWVHYLAFDLFVGAWIARQIMTRGVSRLWLIPLLPATFLFGPAGLAGYALVSALTAPSQKEA